MDQGDEYASNFLVVSPMEDLTKDDTKFEVNLKTDVGIKSKRTIYHSIDTKNWHEVSDVYIDEETGMASFDASKGKHVSSELILSRVLLLLKKNLSKTNI